MELTTSEDIHVVCLFKDSDSASKFNDYVDEHLFHIKNKSEIYGRQVVMNENDEEISEIEDLLIMATDISIMNVKKILRESIKTVLFENIETETRKELDKGKYIEIDNFEEFKDLLSFNSNDDVYYLMIQKRRKDNPTQHFSNGTCEYLRYYIIHSYDELMSLRSEIRMVCIRENARAYITANKRSLSTGFDWAKKYKADPRKYRGMRGVETQMAFGRSFENDITRDRIVGT